jgi:tetratricopeptide (TPR) repeat protein
MDRALYRPLLLTVAVAALAAGRGPAADDDAALREKAIKLNQTTGDSAARARLIELYKDEAGTKKLIDVAVKMVEKDKDKPPLNYNACHILAQAAQLQKNKGAALVFYKACAAEAARLGSQNKVVEAYDGMIDTYITAKDYKDAIAGCKEFLDLKVDDPESPVERYKPFVVEKLAKVLALDGKADEGVRLMDEMIDRYDGAFVFVKAKGDVLRIAERNADAADCYEQALEKLKKNTKLEDDLKKSEVRKIQYTLSNVYINLNQIDKAAQQLETLLKDDPDNTTFLNDLGFIWADHDMKLDEAEKLIRKAIDKDREQRKAVADLPKEDDIDSSAYLDSLGWVLFKKKDYKEAKKYLTEATKLPEGKHIEIYDHLADTHMALGEKAEAVKVWKEALAIDKDLTAREKERRKAIEKKLAAAEKK